MDAENKKAPQKGFKFKCAMDFSNDFSVEISLSVADDNFVDNVSCRVL